MPSTHKSLRSSTANKRPTTAIADGQIALNTNATSPGLFFKDSAGTVLIKIGPVHVGTTAPNVSPAVGGSTGNSTGEAWLDTSLTPNGWKVWTGAAWLNATPAGSATVQGLLELATDAETQAGSDTARAVTPAGLQSKVSDSTSTTSSTTIASSTAVKSAYDLANGALPKSGGTVTGNLEIGTTGSLTFEGATADGFETTIAVVDPTADRTITLPNVTGTVVTTGDTGTVTSTMIASDTIVNADINSSAAIALSKLATGALPTAITIASANIVDGSIVNADVNTSAAIAGTKISPNFGSQTVTTTGVFSAALGAVATPSITFTGDLNTGIYSPGADTLAFVEGGAEAMRIDSSGRLLVGTSSSIATKSQGNVAITPLVQLAGTAISSSSQGLYFYGTAGTSSANLVFSRSNNTTVGSHTVLGSGARMGGLIFTGSDGDEFIPGAEIFAASDAAAADNSMPGRLVFSTTADGAATPTERMRIDNAGTTTLTSAAATAPFIAKISASEVARIDSSGRLLVGTSSARTLDFGGSTATPSLQVEGTSADTSSVSLIRNSAANSAGTLYFGKSRASTVNGVTIVQNNDTLGNINFEGTDGAKLVEAASISSEVDGTPGLDDMPGRLSFNTTADGASSPTERLRITNDGVIAYNQSAPVAVNATATLTIANLKTGIITSTSAAATDMTLPTGTNTEAGFSGVYTNFTFEWSVINTGPSLVRVLAGTAHTVVGSGSVLTGTSGRFASRRSAANTFVTYRLA